VTVLGAVTDDGDSFYCWTEENLTGFHGIHTAGCTYVKRSGSGDGVLDGIQPDITGESRRNYSRQYQLLEALTDKFGQEVVVVLDRAGYFYAKDLREHVSGEREPELSPTVSVSCVRGDDLEVRYFPSKLPELNAVEGWWDRLQAWFKYRLVPDLSSLEDYVLRGVNAISEPNIWPYFIGKDST